MSETTWKVRPHMVNGCHVIDADGVSIYVDKDGDSTTQHDFAERIARLLTEEDERIEREAMGARLQACAATEEGPIANAAWVRWEMGLYAREARPLVELRALEAAYRAVTPGAELSR